MRAMLDTQCAGNFALLLAAVIDWR
jgi:hypothetical protein